MPQRLTVEPPPQLTAKRGAEIAEKLNVSIQPGYHVNSDRPNGEFLIPLKLTWTGTVLHPGSIVYPKSEQIRVGNDEVAVFTGKFTVVTHFKVPPAAPRGPALMIGQLSYQACNNRMCFRPASAEVRLPVVVE